MRTERKTISNACARGAMLVNFKMLQTIQHDEGPRPGSGARARIFDFGSAGSSQLRRCLSEA